MWNSKPALTTALLFILAVTQSSGCAGKAGPLSENPGGIFQRSASIDVWAVPQKGLTEPARGGEPPYRVGAIVSASGPTDTGTIEEMFSQFEISWGDGGGWVDVTAEAYDWDYIWGDGIDTEHISTHTYTSAGTYDIRGRATFRKDGEVVVASNTKTVVVQ